MNLKMLLFASVSLVLFASCHNSDDPYMTLATKTLDVEAEGGLFTVDLSSNVYYRVNNDCSLNGICRAGRFCSARFSASSFKMRSISDFCSTFGKAQTPPSAAQA